MQTVTRNDIDRIEGKIDKLLTLFGQSRMSKTEIHQVVKYKLHKRAERAKKRHEREKIRATKTTS